MKELETDFLKISLQPLVQSKVSVANFHELITYLTRNQLLQIEKTASQYPESRKWFNGSTYVPLKIFVEAFGEGTTELLKLIQKAKFSAMGCSGGKVMLPFKLDENLAYFLGALAGDGCIPNRSPHVRGCWVVAIYEGHPDFHTEVYRPIVSSLFGIEPKFNQRPRPDGRSNYYSAINSVIVVKYLTECLGIKKGKKAHCVDIPDYILNSENPEIKAAFIRGLFDTDGTFTGKTVKFSTVSKKLFEETYELMQELGIAVSFGTWLKSEKFRLLYTIRVKRRSSLRFQQIIGFWNPLKKLKLENYLKAPSSR